MAVYLSDKKCVACEGGISPLNGEQINGYQAQLKTEWIVIDNKKIKREFKFRDFRGAMEFINKVADVAESEGHHPDIYIYYSRVVVELWTHAIGGLSENDFIMAAKIEKLLNQY